MSTGAFIHRLSGRYQTISIICALVYGCKESIDYYGAFSQYHS